MKKLKKRAFLSAALALLTGVSVTMVTLAYFTASDTRTNTFTMGDIGIELEEPNWPSNPDDPDDPDNPGKDLVPGDNKPKDPTVTATGGSSYMRVKMELKDLDSGAVITDPDRISKILKTLYYDKAYKAGPPPELPNLPPGEKFSETELEELAAAGTIDPEYNRKQFELDTARTAKTPGVRYYNYIEGDGIFGDEEGERAVLFSSAVIPSNWNVPDITVLKGGEEAKGYAVVLTAQAIQSENMEGRKEAFAALDAQEAEDQNQP